MTTSHPELEGLGNYEYGWSDGNDAGTNAKRGLSEEVVRDISSKKSEPAWMLDLRLKGLDLFYKKANAIMGFRPFRNLLRHN
jgi:Fe-S cluster assembly protein SufB